MPAEHAFSPSMRFALAKFRSMAMPATLVARPTLHDRLTAGAGKRLTVVVGSAGAGKSLLLSSWVAARPPGTTCWLSCDRADQSPVRFWSGFSEALQSVAPEFGADAADLLAMDRAVTPDVTASIANDAARLPAGSAIVVDDFHYASAAAAKDMADLVAAWPSHAAQLVLSSRVDPPLRLHKLRMSGELCELRQRDLCFSLSESRDLLAKFGVRIADDELALLHQRSEGWAAALQMAALSLRGIKDPARMARALDVRSHAIAEYFISEVLEQQPPEVVRFMLDTSILGLLTADACAAVTGRQDAAVLLRGIDAANLFLVALDEERTSSDTTTWCATCCALSCGSGARLASTSSGCERPNGMRPPARSGSRPATSCGSGNTVRWTCCAKWWWPLPARSGLACRAGPERG